MGLDAKFLQLPLSCNGKNSINCLYHPTTRFVSSWF